MMAACTAVTARLCLENKAGFSPEEQTIEVDQTDSGGKEVKGLQAVLSDVQHPINSSLCLLLLNFWLHFVVQPANKTLQYRAVPFHVDRPEIQKSH